MLITQHKDNLEYLTAPGIAAKHCFTTRLGGVSQGYLDSLNIGIHRGDKPENVQRNYEILADALGFDPGKLILTRQTHSSIVRQVTEEDMGSIFREDIPECDALITHTPGLALVVFTADCTPILFYDPVTGAVGAAHAGWRGTAADIAGKTVAAMVECYGCKAENIRCAIGPNIGQCCFETDAEVPQAMLSALGEDAREHIRQVGQKYYVNLKEINALFLRRSGVCHIDTSEDCTRCDSRRFWSHRLTGSLRGSQGGIIVCPEVAK